MATENSTHLTLPGSAAFSDFRSRALAAKIKARDVRAHWVHYIDLAAALQERQRDVLEQLLTYGDLPPARTELQSRNGTIRTYYVAPRVGTISPWSSKATNIAEVCGLKNVVRRVERGLKISCLFADGVDEDPKLLDVLHDRMTQSITSGTPDLSLMFSQHAPGSLRVVEIQGQEKTPLEVLQNINRELGLALDQSELEYLADAYSRIGRPPTDVELFMFAQVNSEHCRHKQFNASWTIDGQDQPNSLFGMIRNTERQTSEGTISAYSDNAAVLQGENGTFWAPDAITGEWKHNKEVVHYLAKVETHNHPTAVSPFPGAATGSGGEIRDEGAVGRGSRPQAGLAGFCVSELQIPGHEQPWELNLGRPDHIASSLDIMLEAPLGSAAFNNEFGRPCTAGYFRTMLQEIEVGNDGEKEYRGYHKPIMLAGGVGTVRPQHALKDPEIVQPGAFLIVLGGPAMLIGLGGGAASSISSGEGSVDLDFASVQRGNPEMQRRAQEVINACVAMGPNNPIKFIHDVGAGGLSNALPELVHDAGLGAKFELREIENADRSMTPMAIWCCEAQERYVMAVSEDSINRFRAIATRERCGYSVVGRATKQKRLVVEDRESKDHPVPIDLDLSTLFGKPPRLHKDIVRTKRQRLQPFDNTLGLYLPKASDRGVLNEAVNRVLQFPSVGSKSFLITIGDRTVLGLTARDQMVGPWQTPVADVAVTATSLTPGLKTGVAKALGERPQLALISPAASARMAVAESLMNLAAADLTERLHRVKLSANWMCCASHPGEEAAIYDAVEAIGMELCPELGISIPVGKDSMSMKMKWNDTQSGQPVSVIAPLSLNVTAFGPVVDFKKTWTPALRHFEDVGETTIFFVDLALGHHSLGASALAQVFSRLGDESVDIRSIGLFKDFFDACQQLQESGIVLAYHDRSDGGLVTTLAEMMFAGRCGLEIVLDPFCRSSQLPDVIPALFNEELGAVFQVRRRDENTFRSCFSTCGPPPGLIYKIGRVAQKPKQDLVMYHGASLIYRAPRSELQQTWSFTSHQMQRIRDNPICADAEHSIILDNKDPGLSYNLRFDPKANILPWRSSLSSLGITNKPRVAILREQGVNGHSEMAYAFQVAGFAAVDVHMTDLLSSRDSLSTYVGLAACGGFSYGDVLGAGQGWAKSLLFNPSVRAEFKAFFKRKDTFTLGVCNGCQFLSRLTELIPGTQGWPSFVTNESEQYEARVCMVKISEADRSNPSVFLHGMHGSSLPIAIAHGEGRATFLGRTSSATPAQDLVNAGLVPMQYVDNNLLKPTQKYPFNPNGSAEAIAAVRSRDGRCLALMPHPERTIMGGIGSYLTDDIKELENGPWVRLFQSARRWVG